jgi:hypothetical protein
MGVTNNRQNAAAYDDDMRSAKSSGIDAFALHIGTDENTNAQLDFAYESAAANHMKVFISFDFSSYDTGNVSAIGEKIKQYAPLPAQLIVGGKVFASSFGGDTLDISALASATGIDLLFVPNFQLGVNWVSKDLNLCKVHLTGWHGPMTEITELQRQIII